MNGKTILDTTIVIRLFNGDERVRSRIVSLQTYLPAIVVGELAFGANKSARIEQNLKRIDEFVATSTVLKVELETAKIYGHLKQELRRKGRPIPENDLWIASLAVQHGLPIASYDAHFAEIEGLNFESW
jgi:tRNA(fMet)-specific endonuclease VapC